MPTTRDFQPESRVNTNSSQTRTLERQASVLSTVSATIAKAAGVRSRRIARSHTITAYDQPEHKDPTGKPGAEPGIDTSIEDQLLPPQVNSLQAVCEINIVDFSDLDVRHIRADNGSLAQVLAQPCPDDLPCRWISVNGLSWDVIKCLGNHYNLHRLAIEDLIHTHTRTKVDWYADHAYMALTLQKLVRLHDNQGSMDDSNILEEKELPSPKRRWWERRPRKAKKSGLPTYLDRDQDGKIDEYVNAHSSTSEDTPVRPIRTMQRYESAQVAEHTAFMEEHSSLSNEDLAVSVEQVSIFLLANNTVISIFEHSAEDVEAPIRARLQSTETMLRRSCDASMVTQAIIDAIVDLAVPVKDAYNKARKELQIDAMLNPNISTSRALHIFGEEVDTLQNLFRPIVHLVNALRDHNPEPLQPTSAFAPRTEDPDTRNPESKGADTSNSEKTKRSRDGRYETEMRRAGPLKRTNSATSVSISPLAHTYFGDVLDHCLTMIQSFDQMDASASNISTLIFNTVSARTNNFMMILAVVTVLFAPLTFISGYFGMNFARGAGLAHEFAFFWTVAIPSLVGFMLLVFASMLWDNIKDFLAKRGIRAHRQRRKWVEKRRRR